MKKKPLEHGRHRNISVKMWRDPWFADLKTTEKLIWIYLLSCPHGIFIPGLLVITPEIISSETGINARTVYKVIQLFTEVEKIRYAKKFNLVWIVNNVRYNLASSPDNIHPWFTFLAEVPDCDLKHQAINETREIIKEKQSPSHLERFDKLASLAPKVHPKVHPKGTPTGTPLGPPTGLPTGLPQGGHKEKEKEKEKDKEGILSDDVTRLLDLDHSPDAGEFITIQKFEDWAWSSGLGMLGTKQPRLEALMPITEAELQAANLIMHENANNPCIPYLLQVIETERREKSRKAPKQTASSQKEFWASVLAEGPPDAAN